MDVLQKIKELEWYSITANTATGKVGKADLPDEMTVADALSLLDKIIKDSEGDEYRTGAISSYRGRLQLTAFPVKSSGGRKNF